MFDGKPPVKRHFNTKYGLTNDQASKASGRKIGGMLPGFTARRAVTQGHLPTGSGALSALGQPDLPSPNTPIGGVVDSPPADPPRLGGKGPGGMGAAPMGVGSDNARASSTQGAGKAVSGIGGERGQARRDNSLAKDLGMKALSTVGVQTAKNVAKYGSVATPGQIMAASVKGGIPGFVVGAVDRIGGHMIDSAQQAQYEKDLAEANKKADYSTGEIMGVVDTVAKKPEARGSLSSNLSHAIGFDKVIDDITDAISDAFSRRDQDYNALDYSPAQNALDFAAARREADLSRAEMNLSRELDEGRLGFDFGPAQQMADNPTSQGAIGALGLPNATTGPIGGKKRDVSFSTRAIGGWGDAQTDKAKSKEIGLDSTTQGVSALSGAQNAKAASEKAKKERTMQEVSKSLAEKTAKSMGLTTGTGITSGPGIHDTSGVAIPDGRLGIGGGNNGVSGSGGGRGSGSGGQNNGSGPDRGGSGYGGR